MYLDALIASYKAVIPRIDDDAKEIVENEIDRLEELQTGLRLEGKED